eukprot:UN2015
MVADLSHVVNTRARKTGACTRVRELMMGKPVPDKLQPYAIGAGITAAAGTRLALQLILIERFNIHSFQVQDMDALYCYFLSLPPCVRIG